MRLVRGVSKWSAATGRACPEAQARAIRHGRPDIRTGLASVPARFGVPVALWVARASHGVMILCLALVPSFLPLGWLYVGGVAAAALLLVCEHALVRAGRIDRAGVAFFQVNIAVSAVLLLAGGADLLVGTTR